MIEIREVTDPAAKSELCSCILHQLPDWFGIESSIAEYVEEAAGLPFYAAYDRTRPIGFLAVKVHNPYTSEIYVMGILEDFHRQGIGTALVSRAEVFCRDRGQKYLTVKTLDGSAASEHYARTSKFYKRMGFIPLEVFPLLWDEANPCLFLVKYLEDAADHS